MTTNARECGDCSLCCRLLLIDEGIDIDKPADVWCRHCRPGNGGCSIYADRPQICREFQCAWRCGDLGDHWKPSRSKMVIYSGEQRGDDGKFLNIAVDPSSSNRWREPPYYAAIKRLARLGFTDETGLIVTRVIVGDRHWIVLPHKEVEVKVNEAFMLVRREPEDSNSWAVAVPATKKAGKGAGLDPIAEHRKEETT